MSTKCPKCGGDAERISANRFECPYCGENFTMQDQMNNIGMGYGNYQAAAYNSNPPMPPYAQPAAAVPNANQYQQQPVQVSQEDCSGWLKALAFLIPLVGLILYFVKKNEQPVGAKSCLNWAIAGFVVQIVFGLI